MNSTCKLIKELRQETGLTASQFAKVMGVSKSSVSKWENDEVPGIDNLYQIARYFRVSVDELLSGALNIDNDIDRFVLEYDLSSFDVPKLLKERDYEKLILYFKKCQSIKNKFLKFLPRAAYFGLTNTDLAEYQYLSKYIFIDSNVIRYERDFDARYSRKLDPNEMKAVKEFYEKIKHLSKAEKEWEIDKIYSFKPKLYLNEVISAHNYVLFVEMFKVISQADKNSILNNTINNDKPINSIRNQYVLAMIENGAKVLKWSAWHCNYWDEEVVRSFEGELNPVDRKKHNDYQESNYYRYSGDCSYSDYLEVIDEEKTSLLKEACLLRKKKPKEYYRKLKDGHFDLILDY